MAEVTAELVKELREKTGARLLDTKKALDETKAEFSGKGKDAWLAAGETWLRKKSLDKGGAMAEKAATEGLLGYKTSADNRTITVVEMTANTDFVAKNAEFLNLLKKLVEVADAKGLDHVDKLAKENVDGAPALEQVKALAGKIGENIGVKRVVRFSGDIGFYIHHDNKQGAIVELSGIPSDKAAAIGKDLAMHVVFAKPNFLSRDQVSPETVKKETDIAAERLKNDPKNANKPPEILQKIAAGQLNKYYSNVVLPEQPYYKDGSKTVTQVLKDAGNGTIKAFVRFEVGVV